MNSLRQQLKEKEDVEAAYRDRIQALFRELQDGIVGSRTMDCNTITIKRIRMTIAIIGHGIYMARYDIT